MAKKKGITSNREKKVQVSFNDKEYELMCSYAKKYKIENRSKWIRETLIGHILKNLEMDYPTLFGENEMRR